MNKGQRHILLTWIILLCFAAGQWAVYAHKHANNRTRTFSSKHQSSRSTISETCQLCDAMHYSTISHDIAVHFVPLSTSDYVYKPGQYNFISISLILSAGRAPPVS